MEYVLYRRGRPTSVVLLLLMIIAKLSLALSRHPSLCLHHLFGLARAARWLVSLSCVEVLEIGTREGSLIAEFTDGVVARGRTPHTGICLNELWEPNLDAKAVPNC